MLLCRRPPVFSSDALGLASLSMIVAGLLFGVALPARSAFDSEPRLRAELAAASTRYDDVTARNRRLAEAIRAQEAALQALLDARPTETGEFLEYVSTRCLAHGFQLQQVAPQGETTQGEQRSWEAEVRAAGPFGRFPKLLAEIEAWSPFVQVRSLSINGPTQGIGTDCQLTWTVRVNSLVPRPPGAKPGS